MLRILCLSLLGLPILAAETAIAYIAHAAFVVTSPDGVALALDPFNSNRWLGYSFPDGVQADGVLITHPHYDHDANYQFQTGTPVFRLPGRYSIGDARILGVEGKHALHYGQEFGQLNTVWMIEVGGVRVVHVGDNGPLSPEALGALGSADILLAPVDDLEHILTFAEIEEMAEQLAVKVLIPMHYRIEAISRRPESVGPIDRWLDGLQRVRRLDRSSVTIEQASLPAEREVWALPPSPQVRVWDESLELAWQLRDRARESPDGDRVALLHRAAGLAPRVTVFAVELAEALVGLGRKDEATGVLEDCLLRGVQGDNEYVEKAHLMLGRQYREAGREEDARAQFQALADRTWRLEWREEALR